MKIPISDKFLLDLCKFLDETEDIFRFFLHPPRSWGQFCISEHDPMYRKYRKVLKSERFNKLIYYLKKKNYIKAKNLEGKKAIMLTPKGMNKAFRYSFKIGSQDKKKRKDNKWIMLIFDIPQKNDRKRELLREVLKSLGYKMFQKSVWVTPYDVFNKTENFLQFHSLDQYVRLLLVEKI